MGKSCGIVAEDAHEVLPKLARLAYDRDSQTAPSLAIVSFNQRMLK
jgi:hypothetical protein